MNDEPAALAAGKLFKQMAALPPAEAAAVMAAPQTERERLMALDGAARAAALAEIFAAAASDDASVKSKTNGKD